MCRACAAGQKPLAAVWWRVSTESQVDVSPQTQIHEAQELAESDGCLVPTEHIIGCDWHSLSVWDSPAMEQLKDLIRSGEVHAVYLYDADRGPAKPAHRMMFRALCEENGVEVRCKHGQVPAGDMSEVMEFLSAWQKEKQVQRAQQGARDGLRDRALLKGLPVNGASPYGYRLRYELDEKGQKVRWIPPASTCVVGCGSAQCRSGDSGSSACHRRFCLGTGTGWFPASKCRY